MHTSELEGVLVDRPEVHETHSAGLTQLRDHFDQREVPATEDVWLQDGDHGPLAFGRRHFRPLP